ncbi:uncharacterized protein LOC129869742 [Solanum dulcamara]|uniref:uncharacterized protein LOC129869742 n=1 Tax=Solanum dulcamara TaxID=45834 RepID=UPI0024863BE4|nr:uncharacterized protein LOC129869742 [Solanum dulcamara]
MADRVHRYVMGINRHLIDSCMDMASQQGMDISRYSRYPPQPAQSAPPQFIGRRLDSTGYTDDEQSSRVLGSQMNRGSCFTYGYQGHFMRDCPLKSNPGGAAQPTGSMAGSSSSIAMRHMGRGMQVPAGHGRGRGGASSASGPSNRIYTLASRQDQEASPNVVTGVIALEVLEMLSDSLQPVQVLLNRPRGLGLLFDPSDKYFKVNF